jgi:hypothetical protein
LCFYLAADSSTLPTALVLKVWSADFPPFRPALVLQVF